MGHAGKLVTAVLFAGIVCAAAAHGADRPRSLSVRFPAFALSPGERIAGVTLTSSSGLPVPGCTPNRWRCDREGNTTHCYTMHPTYATAISGMIPEFIVPGPRDAVSLQASVEFIDNDGKEYSREIRQDDLIVR